jgi:serine/threonine protein kinase
MGACSSCFRAIFFPKQHYREIVDEDEKTPIISEGSSTYDPSINSIGSLTNGHSDKNAIDGTITSSTRTQNRSKEVEIGSVISGSSSGYGGLHDPYQQMTKAMFFAKYELRDEIGVGSTSKCYKCVRRSDGRNFACKVIDKKQVELKFSGLLDQFFVEIKVLKTLDHPHIIKLEDTFESTQRIYMVMEMMRGGELFDYVVEKGTLSEEEASKLVRSITSAVAHMHNQDIIHRDLKPENLLLTHTGIGAEVKLIDFGLAKVMREAVASSFLGTKGYLAPEMLQRHSYDKAIDMWALGVIVFVLLCGCLPFDDDSSKIPSETAARKKFTLRFPKWAASLSTSAKDLLHNLLEINPKTRYTADQALNHPWVSGKTVMPNSYLQSPCVLGERRRDLRSPLPAGYMADLHNKATEALGGAQGGRRRKNSL